MNERIVMDNTGFDTKCVHSGGYADDVTGGVATPIFRSTSHRIMGGAVRYPRYFNVPTERAAAEKIRLLEHGGAAVVLGSGMAAITTVLFAMLRRGDHTVMQNDIYGGTFNFVISEFAGLGIEYTFVRGESIGEFEAALRPNTKLVYFETPSNPLLNIVDIRAMADMAKKRGILTVMDGTFATPVNQTPLDYGMDIVVHSGTKYLNGHSDVLCGAIVTSDELMKKILPYAINHGGVLDAMGCWLLERGLKTLGLRMKRHNENALKIAEFLKDHKMVKRVYYPGLKSHPGYKIAKSQMRGFGGVVSFELDCDLKTARKIVDRFKYVTPAVSLGGVESLVCFPAETSHAKMPKQEREKVGISDTLLRLSVGIEDAEDLINDMESAFKI